jgi:serine/threonine protein kinase
LHSLLHCCQAQQDWVLRCYDDRFQATERKPEFYLVFDEDGKPIGETVLHVFDKETSQGGGASDENNRAMHVKYSCMWKVSGQLRIIRTQFWPGGHTPLCPSDFLPIIAFLEYMHEKGFVHGDIRCFNMIFNGKNGKLIDFDYSGRDFETKYPRGYQSILPDGVRLGREETKSDGDSYDTVPKWHDWFALGQVILCLHTFKPATRGDAKLSLMVTEAKEQLETLMSDKDTALFINSLKELLLAHAKARSTCSAASSLRITLQRRTSPVGSQLRN